jgi:hypothetical protein
MSLFVAALVTIFVLACWFAVWCLVRAADSIDDDEYPHE